VAGRSEPAALAFDNERGGAIAPHGGEHACRPDRIEQVINETWGSPAARGLNEFGLEGVLRLETPTAERACRRRC